MKSVAKFLGIMLAIGIIAGVFYYTMLRKSHEYRSYYDPRQAEDVAVFFNYVKEELPKLPQKIGDLKKQLSTAKPEEKRKIEAKMSYHQDDLKFFPVVAMIADGDIAALKSASPKDLQLQGQIWVNADKFKDKMGGRLTSRIWGGNALAIALFHSAMNRTAQDNAKTLEMIKILLEKGVDPHAIAGEVFWVKDEPAAQHSLDYVAHFSLPQVALIYSFPEALELLFKKYVMFDKKKINLIINDMKEKKLKPHLEDFERLFLSYVHLHKSAGIFWFLRDSKL